MDWGTSVLSLLASVSVRALIIAACAWTVLRGVRAPTAATRHAVWTVALAGMLLSLLLAPVLPPIPLRVLSAPPAAHAVVTASIESVAVVSNRPLAVGFRLSWPQVVAAGYAAGVLIFLLRLAFAYGFLWKLVRGSARVEREVFESSWIAVPMTTGWLRPKILLPRDWREWDREKLDAVLAHERAHVARADWLIAGVAAINRSVFWFHPLAWWLERTLAGLAEQACDDAALGEAGSREQYARVLLDMAAAVKSRRGRMVWEAMAMAKVAEVHVRIDRILDETRVIPPGWNRRRWAGLLAFSVPVICVVSVLQLAPARAMEQERPASQSAAPPAPAPTPAPEASQTVKTPRTAPRPARTPQPNAQPQPVKTVIADYPAAAVAAKVVGSVRLSITVSKDGRVTDVTSATGHPLLISAATDAVRQWIYDLRQAATQLEVEVPFQVRETPLPVAGDLQLIKRVEPEYPQIAKQTGAKGVVELVATIGRDGHVKAVKVISGHPMLQNAAVKAVQEWVYRPTDAETQAVVKLNFAGVEPPSSPRGNITQAVLIRRVEPVMPKDAPQGESLATVTLRALIGMDGSTRDITVLSGDPIFAAAAVDAVKQWKYSPTMLNGAPVVTETQIVLRFAAPGR